MNDKARFLTAISFFVLASWLQAEETYTIKIRKPQKGDSYWIERNQTTEGSVRAVTAEGEELVRKKVRNEAKADSYRETVLAVEAGDEIARLRRAYEKGQMKTDDKTEKYPFVGKTVIIEKRMKRFHFLLQDGPELLGKDVGPLTDEFNSFAEGQESSYSYSWKDYFPEKAVRLNEEWTLDPKVVVPKLNKLLQGFDGPQASEDHFAGTGTLQRIYEKDGCLFGVMNLRMKFPLQGRDFTVDGTKVRLGPDSRATEETTVDICIDGSKAPGQAISKATLDVEYTLPSLGDVVKVKVKAQLVSHRKWKN